MTDIAIRCSRCGKETIGPCDCSQKAMRGVNYPWPDPWNRQRAYPPHPQANPAQQEKLDKIIALLEEIKERL